MRTLNLMILLLVLRSICLSSAGNASEMNMVGKDAPNFILKNYDGENVELASHKGEIIVLEWFNYECPFSIYIHEEKPVMADLTDKYKDVVWIAVNSTSHQDTSKNEEFAEKNDIAYPILDDSDGKVGKLYGAKTTPHMFVISKDGKVLYEGAIDDSPLGRKEKNVVNYVDKALAEILHGKEVSMPYVKPYGCSVKYK